MKPERGPTRRLLIAVLLVGGLGCYPHVVHYRVSAPEPEQKLGIRDLMPVRYYEHEDDAVVLRVAAVNHVIMEKKDKSILKGPVALRFWIEVEPRTEDLSFNPWEVTLSRERMGDDQPRDVWLPAENDSEYSRVECLVSVTGMNYRGAVADRPSQGIWSVGVPDKTPPLATPTGRRFRKADPGIEVPEVACFGLEFGGAFLPSTPLALAINGLSEAGKSLPAPVIHFSEKSGRFTAWNEIDF
jgi:hypothetical protein